MEETLSSEKIELDGGQQSDLCAVMDEALCFLNTTMVPTQSSQIINLDLLHILVNVFEKRINNEHTVLKSIHYNYLNVKSYDGSFRDKQQRLTQS
jgi:hypothetical protein